MDKDAPKQPPQPVQKNYEPPQQVERTSVPPPPAEE